MNRYCYLLIILLLLPLTALTQQKDLVEVDKALLKRQLFNTQQNSYYDSVSVFTSGNTALALAKKLGDKSAEAEITIYYGNFYYYSQDFPTSEAYFKKALALAKKAKDKHFERLARIRMTFIKSEVGNRSDSNEDFKKLIDESRKANDHTNTIEAMNGLAISMELQMKPQEAAKLYLDGLRIAEKNDLTYYRAVILNNMGLVKMGNGQSQEALKDFKEAYEVSQKMQNLRLAFHALNNVGLSYSEQGHNDSAIMEYRKTLVYAHLINHPRELATAYANIGFSLSKVKNFDEALSYYDSAKTVLRDNNMTYELIKGLLGEADILIRTKNFTKAETNIAEAEKHSIYHKDLQTQAYCHLLLHRVRKENKQFESALNEYLRYKELMDSVELIRNKKQITELQIQYDVEKKDNQLKEARARETILEQENEIKRIKIRAIIITALIILMLLGAFFYTRYIRNLKKQQEKFSQILINNIEEERSRIARDLHDDIGQSLSVIKSKINMESHGANTELKNLESEVGKIIEQTRDISRTLYPSYLEKIGLTRSVARLMEKIQSSSTLECSFDIAESTDTLNLEQQTHLYRIIQECINNTIKHSGAKALKITIEENGGHFQYTYMDNGKGLSHSSEAKGIGFLSMKERAKMLNGEMNVGQNNGKGFRLMIKFNHTIST